MTQKIQKEINMNKKILIFAVLAFALVLSACGPTTINQAAPENLRTLNVNGVGQVYLTPDIAYVNIGVNTQSASASESVATNKEQSNAVIESIKAAGVDAKDIHTTNFSIWSNPQYDTNGLISGTTYVVDNTVNVTVHNLDSLGDLLDSAISAGANSIYSIQFDVADKSAAVKEARASAVEDAKTQAQELAEAAGLSLVEIQTISFFESTPAAYFEGKGGGGGVASEAAVVPIQPGQLAISVSVSVTYLIK